MLAPEIRICPAVNYPMKFKSGSLEHFAYRLAVIVGKIKDADLAAHICHVRYDLSGLRLANGEIVFCHIKSLSHLNESLNGKRIVLRRDGEFLFQAALAHILFEQALILLIKLPRIQQKLRTVSRRRNALCRCDRISLFPFPSRAPLRHSTAMAD